MEASILDLRYRMKEVLTAIERNESVLITYRGKPKARLQPLLSSNEERGERKSVRESALFGSMPHADPTLDDLRGGRYRAL